MVCVYIYIYIYNVCVYIYIYIYIKSFQWYFYFFLVFYLPSNCKFLPLMCRLLFQWWDLYLFLFFICFWWQFSRIGVTTKCHYVSLWQQLQRYFLFFFYNNRLLLLLLLLLSLFLFACIEIRQDLPLSCKHDVNISLNIWTLKRVKPFLFL